MGKIHYYLIIGTSECISIYLQYKRKSNYSQNPETDAEMDVGKKPQQENSNSEEGDLCKEANLDKSNATTTLELIYTKQLLQRSQPLSDLSQEFLRFTLLSFTICQPQLWNHPLTL